VTVRVLTRNTMVHQERENDMFQRLLVVVGFLVALLAVPALQVQAAPSAPALAIRAPSPASYGHAALSFEPNVGQADPHVRFLVHGPGYTLFLTDHGMVVSAPHYAATAPSTRLTPRLSTPRVTSTSVIRLSFLGGSAHPQFQGMSKLAGKVNYFIGNNPKKWYTSIPTYAQVTVRTVYPGISLSLYSHAGQLEYDWLVAPHADVARIHLGVTGPGKLQIDHAGAVQLKGGVGSLIEGKPVVYQRVGGEARSIAAHYRVQQHAVQFQLGQYNHSLPLTIDPSLVYSTYLGGSTSENGRGTTVNAAGNQYVTGYTTSADFPTHTPYQGTYLGGGLPMAFVTEFNPSGSALIFSTYFGGSSITESQGIALDRYGDIYITGNTSSPNMPTANALQSTFEGNYDAFITKLNPSGSALLFSTYLGGTDADIAYAVAVDRYGYAYIAGTTSSIDFPMANPLYSALASSDDAFVAKIFPDGSGLIYSTYLGGTGQDLARGIAVDAAGDAYVTGDTYSSDFPMLNANQSYTAASDDAFVTKLNPSGSALLFSTYLGGTYAQAGEAIALDPSGKAYVTGYTLSSDFPTLNAYQSALGASGAQNAFVTSFTASGALNYSTYLGGSGNSVGWGIAVDAAGFAYIAGQSDSTFPVVAPIQGANGGSVDAIVSRLSPSGNELLFSTYLGGSGGELATAISVDGKGYAYLTGYTNTSTFPTVVPFQATNRGASNTAFVTKLSVLGAGFAPITAPALSTLIIGGSAWGPAETVTVVWNCATPSCTSAHTWTPNTDGIGNFAVNTTVPNTAPGTYPVIFKSASRGYILTSYTVAPVPKLTFKSANGSTGSFATLTGTGFRSHENIAVKWNCSSLACSSKTTVGVATAHIDGTFSLGFSVPLGWSAGTYPVAAIGATSTSIALANFTVITATLALSPTSGHAGSAATVTGTGFRPGETVIVKWNCATIDCTSVYELRAKHELVPLQDAPIRLTAVVADSGGHISKGITIPSGFSVGSYPIAATGDYSNTFAKTTFTIN
jgi:hypothetical protein